MRDCMDSSTWNGNGSVVVPGIGAPSTVACVRSLGRRGVRTIVVSSDDTTPAFRSAYCDEAVRVPSPHDDLVAYKDALRSLAMRPDVRAVIPVREPDVYVLSKYSDEFADHVRPLWPPFETLAEAQDRKRLFEAAGRAGVATPETDLFTTQPDRDREWIVKPRYTILGDEYVAEYGPETCVAPPSTRYLESGRVVDTGEIYAEMKHVPLIQECIPTTDEYGFFALYDQGEPVATFQHRQRRGWSYAGGPSAYRESIDVPALEDAGLALLDELEWHGLAMVEFLRDPRTGGFTLMEINPRFWSSLPFSVRVGADFPYYYWSLATDTPIDPGETYDVDVGGHLLRGEASYLHSILAAEYPMVDRPHFGRALQTVATSLVRQPRFDYAVAGDPLPFLRDGLNVARDWWARDDHPQPPAESRSQGSTTPVADDEDAVGVGSSVGTDR